jgi:hypothetical protein
MNWRKESPTFMKNNHPTRTDYLRYAHEFLFSLNIAFLAKLQGNQKPNKLFSFLDSAEFRIQLKINAYLNLHPHSHVGGYTAFFALAFGLALCIFLLLRIFSNTSLAKEFLRCAAGFMSLLALPISWFYVTQVLGPVPFSLNLPRPWLISELILIIACAVLYLLAKWSLPMWSGVLLLALHFGFWGWLALGPFFWRYPFWVVFPMAGFCSSLVWGRYVSDQGPARK